jgi:Zn-dependent protease
VPEPSHACPQCGTEIAAFLLACPGCGALVHADELKRLADEAARAAQPAEALAAWRRAHALLPPGSRQRATVERKMDELARLPENAALTAPPSADPHAPKSLWARITGSLGIVGVLLLKFKTVVFLVLTKAKLLLLGLTKMTTLISMFVSFGFYWSLWGWQFAAGFVLSIYIHEMGHIAMLRRLGIPCTAPMFIPGFGALIRLRANLPTAREEALVGLAGPMWGLGAAVAAFALSRALGSPMFAAIAQIGAIINLFNLTPVWQLDGSHAFRALTRTQRWIVVASVLAAWLVSGVGMLMLVLIVAVWRAFEKEAAPEPNHRALGEFVFLVATLSLLASIRVAA